MPDLTWSDAVVEASVRGLEHEGFIAHTTFTRVRAYKLPPVPN